MATQTRDNKNTEIPATAEPFVSVKIAAEFLGIPENTCYKLALSRKVPSYKAGKLRRFKISELAAWMEGNRVAAGE
ncbi:helix-turn-helix domain-containing protein [Desulfuromonas thiophila]|uniref:helix-turn-helix domain-containing protein n=1 Tax=Desulfuromonas thiophila TaxID=57664 RepID=UPI0024A93D84|nr:helix-turn-helix domain-containing protein [Desulfuromonas thiophila]